MSPAQDQAELHHVRRIRNGVVGAALDRAEDDLRIPFIAQGDDGRSCRRPDDFVHQTETGFGVASRVRTTQIKQNDVAPSSKIRQSIELNVTAGPGAELGPQSPCQWVRET